MHSDGHVREWDLDGRLGLVHCHPRSLHPLQRQHHREDAIAHRFYEVGRFPLDDLGNPAGHNSVVDRVGNVVTLGSMPEGRVDLDIDDKRLTLSPLFRKYTVVAKSFDALDGD